MYRISARLGLVRHLATSGKRSAGDFLQVGCSSCSSTNGVKVLRNEKTTSCEQRNKKRQMSNNEGMNKTTKNVYALQEIWQ